jgi:cupin superfamily acireductone dioxygenase involved in methionine salvage
MQEINDLDVILAWGGGWKIFKFLNADDIVCIAASEDDLQRIPDTFPHWCRIWRDLMDTEKSKCINFRSDCERKTNHSFSK